MKILHYSLGLPPYRTGGLTKYSVDLMESQITQGNDVTLLFPGQLTLRKKTKIKVLRFYNGIQVFEIINPLPVPLMNGISKPEAFMKTVIPTQIYKDFLADINPDIIHVHTLMGIHQEFFNAARELKIKIAYTTHDYFGLSTKPNIIEESENNFTYSQNAHSQVLIYLMQSKLYRNIKDSKFIQRLRTLKKGPIEVKQMEKEKLESINEANSLKYIQLKEYYYRLFDSINVFLFNSSVTKDVFEKYIELNGKVIPVTHNDIKDNRTSKKFNENNPLRISFLGPIDRYKGFSLLREAVNILLERNYTNWHLNVYGNKNELPLNINEKYNITFHGRYKHNELSTIFNNTDILVVPSIWKETFGFIGLEALSYGVPTLVSENVGFQDLITNEKTGIIFKANSLELSNTIERLINNREVLNKINNNICNEEFPWVMETHNKEIINLYTEVIGEKK